MKLGVLGTGMVGEAIASKLVGLGHQVMMGSRDASNPRALAWAQRLGPRARAGSFAETAVFGELLFNCTHGANSLDALRAVGEQRLAGKVLIDVANILPPQTRASESLAEQLQRQFPQTRVVKALNTMNCELMVEPMKLSGAHTVFMSGNDSDSKKGSERSSRPWGGKTSLTWGTSVLHARPRVTCRSGLHCASRWARSSSTSTWCARGEARRF